MAVRRETIGQVGMNLVWKQEWRPQGENIRASRTNGLPDSRLAAYMDYHPDAIVLLNREGIMLRVNRTFETMFGYTRAEVENKLAYECPVIPPSELPGVAERHARALNGEVVAGVETVRIAKDGRRIDVVVTVRPLVRGDDGVDIWISEFRDVTWQRH
ncbi:PAS domain-containing protein [Paenibacillus methanolicus]|uniref:PAS domain S-box-containing protein n=1 Tax=Paenibacillus methanolicus TaxID=582686 RepID=A0A5S5C7Y0_9BACL|nr:PAS domain S-box protein [Paenibacillus methanolicus]TYP75515.1 PAS domain S-box-containing protein [Paenibacillus methanolicus]